MNNVGIAVPSIKTAIARIILILNFRSIPLRESSPYLFEMLATP